MGVVVYAGRPLPAEGLTYFRINVFFELSGATFQGLLIYLRTILDIPISLVRNQAQLELRLINLQSQESNQPEAFFPPLAKTDRFWVDHPRDIRGPRRPTQLLGQLEKVPVRRGLEPGRRFGRRLREGLQSRPPPYCRSRSGNGRRGRR